MLIYWLVYTPFVLLAFQSLWALFINFLSTRYSFWTTQKSYSDIRIHVPTHINENMSLIKVGILFILVFWPTWTFLIVGSIKIAVVMWAILIIPNIFMLKIIED